MLVRVSAVFVLVVCALVPSITFARFGPAPGVNGGTAAVGRPAGGGLAHYHYVTVARYFNSFTSYQFPNPFPPNQDPLSRLEFPIDQWFIGLGAGCRSSTLSFAVEVWTNLSRESGLKMQDSDWDDDADPGQKTIFSESGCRLNKGILTDIRIGLNGGPFGWASVQPIVGHRYQHFFFTTYDGYQWDLDGGDIALEGDGIDFKQSFHHVYFGGALDGDISPGRIFGLLPRVGWRIQIDYALVNARNEDLHLLRLGERITTENTWGHCWHAGADVTLVARNMFRAGLSGDFKRIVTHGDHRLSNHVFGVDFSFDGSKVWSDQSSLSAFLEVFF